MKHLLTFLTALFWINTGVFSQQVSRTDPTWFRVDYGNMSEMIRWKGEAFRNIYFEDSVAKPGLLLKIMPNKYRHIGKKNFTPFVLDTVHINRSGYFAFTANPEWFYWLKRAEADNMSKAQVMVVGKLKKNLRISQASVKELFRLLLEFGVIRTYFHLYAELVIAGITEDESRIEFAYNCVYHFCTTKCFDPAYSFKLQFDKNTKEIVLVMG